MARATGEGRTRPLETSPQGCPTAHLIYNFDIDGAALKPEHRNFLDTVARILRGNRGRFVPISGFTEIPRVELLGRASPSGTDRHNLQLSQQRVEAVAEFLRSHGVLDVQIRTRAIGEQAPFSIARNAEEDRSVEVRVTVPRILTLVLRNTHTVQPIVVLMQTIREAIGPLVLTAGRELHMINMPVGGREDGDLNLAFERGLRPFLGRPPRQPGAGPNDQFFIMGEAGGTIEIDLFEELRVGSLISGGGGRRRDPRNFRDIDVVSQTEPLFSNGEPEFARAVGNVAVHEIGHQIALREHSNDPYNFMSGMHFPPANRADRRTRENLRRLIAGRKHFASDQTHQLVCHIQTGDFPDAQTVQ